MIIKQKYNNAKLSLVIALLLFTPAFVHGFLGASSFAAGLLLANIVILLFVRRVYYLSIAFVTLCSFLTLSFLLSLLFVEINVRALLSFPLFLFFILTAYICSNYVYYHSYKIIPSKDSFLVLFLIFLVLGFLTAITNFGFSHFFYDTHKPIFPFNEPSHYALAIAPLYCYLLIRFDFLKSFVIMLLMFLLTILLQSLLMFLITISIFSLFHLSKIYLFPLLTFFISVSLYFLIGDAYYHERLNISSASTNLTALVYLQGLQDAALALKSNPFFGLGFQMLGFQEPSPAHFRILEVLGQDSFGAGLNRFDGGFLAAKAIAELGAIGVLFAVYYVYLLFKSLLFIISRNMQSFAFDDPLSAFCIACVVCFSFEFFLRGVGYFSPGVLMFIFSYFYLKRRRFF